MLDSISNKVIFISVLDWGSGHLNRTAVIIEKLKEKNHIVIFSTENQKLFYSKLFPDILQEDIHSYNINFNPDKLLSNIIFNIHHFFSAIRNERKILENYIKTKLVPDLIISDNRYGFYYSGIKSICITHQINLQVPKIFSFAQNLNFQLLKNFDEIWIPDYEDEEKSLAGKLSHNENLMKVKTLKYIQPLSLFKKIEAQKEIYYLFIISGTKKEKIYYEKVFEKLAKSLQIKNKDVAFKIIGSLKNDGNLFLGWKNYLETNQLIAKSNNIITRPGYSTLMDLHYIKDDSQKIYLIEPKFQYEQKYLYHYWIEKKLALDIKELPT
ncbi:MAG TPA: hypothetical protein PK995_09925 [Bacteroidia bacterium]|nr:hypothetical protein [Bacteroidia bacterium]